MPGKEMDSSTILSLNDLLCSEGNLNQSNKVGDKQAHAETDSMH